MNLYHYTLEMKAALILESGKLIPTGTPATPREKPVLWFSSNGLYEPTAIKPLAYAGLTHYPTFDEYAEMFKLYRFKLVSNRYLAPWKTINQRAKVSSKLVKRMEIVGEQQGGKPSQWFGTLDEVPVEELVMQVYVNGAWFWAKEDEMPQKAPPGIVSARYEDMI